MKEVTDLLYAAIWGFICFLMIVLAISAITVGLGR